MKAWRRAVSLWWSFVGRLSQPWCPHDSMTGDEGPVADLGRWPNRWRCDQCSAIIRTRSEVKEGAFCDQCGGPYTGWLEQYGGHWDTCPNRPMTRTEQGYAMWKDDPAMVAAARVQAKGRIALRLLWRELFESWAAPLLDWVSERLEHTFRK